MQKDLNRLSEIEKEMSLLGGASALLGWDQETIMPKAAIKQRGEQRGYLSMLIHQKSVSKELKGIINRLSKMNSYSKLSSSDQVRVRKHKRLIKKQSRIPASFVEEFSRLAAEGQHSWEIARVKQDFKIFEPYLQKLIAMNLKYAKMIDPKKHPYDVLLDDYEEGMTIKELDRVFDRLKPDLIELINKIKSTNKYKTQKSVFSKIDFPAEKQKMIVKDIFNRMGAEKNRSIIGESTHPFTTMISADDSRITTNYRKGKPMFSFTSTVHETGHLLYNLGFPKRFEDTILFAEPSLGIHESQSRFWEIQIALRKEFWQFYYPVFRRTYKELRNVSLDRFYESVNMVKPSLVRIEADEVTYPLHVIIRYEIEKGLMEGKIKVKDLPEVWNRKYKEYLGIVPDNVVDGVLQDVHWSHGGVGYFPTYVLGTIYAAMVFNQMSKEFDVKKNIKKGNFKPVLDWLRKNIHSKGALFLTKDLIKQICGKNLDSDDLMNYFREKYDKIYGIEN